MLCARESRWWHGDTPKAMDLSLEVVKIDLSCDRLKDTKKLSKKETKLLLQVSIAFYLSRGLNRLRRKLLGLTSGGAIWGDLWTLLIGPI